MKFLFFFFSELLFFFLQVAKFIYKSNSPSPTSFAMSLIVASTSDSQTDMSCITAAKALQLP